MARVGFFTRVDAKKAASRPQRAPGRTGGVTIETVRKLGPKAVERMNPEAKHPAMEPTGAARPLVYILGEAPGATEDDNNEQFVGKAGQHLRSRLPGGYKKITRFDNCCRTRPPGNRTPEPIEIEAFRKEVERSIEEAKPAVIILAGGTALNWLLPGTQITAMRGRRIPAKIGSHVCWAVPVLHPSFVVRVKDSRSKVDDVPGSEWAATFDRDLRDAYALARRKSAVPKIMPSDEKSLSKGTELIWCGLGSKLKKREAYDQLVAGLEWAAEQPELSFDIETDRLRPYYPDALLLSWALSDGERTLSFPWEHPEAGWTPSERKALLALLEAAVLADGATRIAHNAPFEIEWMLRTFGPKRLRAPRWECTQSQAYLLDERKGAHSLDILVRLYFGFYLKELSQVDRTAMLEMHGSLKKLLSYNALDAKMEHLLWLEQSELVEKHRLQRAYEEQCRRMTTVVLMQAEGLCVDQDESRRLQTKLAADREMLVEKLFKTREALAFEKRFGVRLNPASNDHMRKLFRDLLKCPEGERGSSYTTDKTMLTQVRSKHPIAGVLLDLRGVEKLKGTYVDSHLPGAKRKLVYPDGRMHPQFKTTSTDTGRLSAEEPSGQNYPKRKHAFIRKQVVPPPGWLMIASDYGQIEVKIIGCHSKDKVLCKALWEEHDIHLEWAERFCKVYPKCRKRHGGDIKKFRSDVKNQWTFPNFYGAAMRYVASLMDVPERILAPLYEEFWDQFAGVHAWQKQLMRDYREKGYVEGLTGRRRRAPMSENMVINTPVQGAASDVTVDAMNRLSEYIDEHQIDWLKIVLNIHDDMTCIAREEMLEDALILIIRHMLEVPYPWYIVPATIDVEVGRNWYEMEPIGTFKSNHDL